MPRDPRAHRVARRATSRGCAATSRGRASGWTRLGAAARPGPRAARFVAGAERACSPAERGRPRGAPPRRCADGPRGGGGDGGHADRRRGRGGRRRVAGRARARRATRRSCSARCGRAARRRRTGHEPASWRRAARRCAGHDGRLRARSRPATRDAAIAARGGRLTRAGRRPVARAGRRPPAGRPSSRRSRAGAAATGRRASARAARRPGASSG